MEVFSPVREGYLPEGALKTAFINRVSYESSDIDVLCVMKSPIRHGDLISRTSKDTAEVSLKYDIVISRAFVNREDYDSCRNPFLMNVHREQLTI